MDKEARTPGWYFQPVEASYLVFQRPFVVPRYYARLDKYAPGDVDERTVSPIKLLQLPCLHNPSQCRPVGKPCRPARVNTGLH